VEELIKVYATRSRLSSDGRCDVAIFDCPHCKRGKNQEYDSILKWTGVEYTCYYCGKEFIVINKLNK